MKFEKYFDQQLQRECYRFDVTINGRRHRPGKFPNKAAAERALTGLRMQAMAVEFGLPTPPIVVTVKQLLAEIETNTNTKQRLVLSLFREVVDETKPVKSLSRADMAKFKALLIERGLQPGSQRHYRATLYSMLNRAGEVFETLEDWRPPKFPSLDQAECRTRVLTTDEMTAICAQWRQPECYPRESEKWRDYRLELFDISRLMLLTAARKEEIENITAASVNWRTGWLNLRSDKVGRSHLIPLNGPALALLDRRRGREPMFPTLAANVMHYVGQRIRVEGCPYGQHKPNGWTPHDFRRTAAAWIESSGLPYSIVSAMLGHSRKDVTAVYTPADREQLRRAADLLEKLCRDIDGFLADFTEECGTLWNFSPAKHQ